MKYSGLILIEHFSPTSLWKDFKLNYVFLEYIFYYKESLGPDSPTCSACISTLLLGRSPPKSHSPTLPHVDTWHWWENGNRRGQDRSHPPAYCMDACGICQNPPSKGENSTALGHPWHLLCHGERYWAAKENCKSHFSYRLCSHLWFIQRERYLCSHPLGCWYLVPVSLPLFTAPSSVKLKVPVQFANSSPFCQLNCSPLARKRGSWYLISFIRLSLSAWVLMSFFLTQKCDYDTFIKNNKKIARNTRHHLTSGNN